MSVLQQLAPFALVALGVAAVLARTLREAIPAIRRLDADLAACPAARALHYRVCEMRPAAPAAPAKARVIALPVRPRARPLPAPAQHRAAA